MLLSLIVLVVVLVLFIGSKHANNRREQNVKRITEEVLKEDVVDSTTVPTSGRPALDSDKV